LFPARAESVFLSMRFNTPDVPPSLETLDTPCLVIERGRLERNLGRFAAIVAARGVRLRPHLKTAKSIDIARLAAPDPATPVAVSTLLEAEYFFGHGYRDIFYAVGLGPGKLLRAAKLLRAGARLLTCLDDAALADAVAKFSVREQVDFRVLLELDCGEHRGGFAVGAPELVAAARSLGACFAGVATHAGQSYGARSPGEMMAVAEAEAAAARTAVAQLAAVGLESTIVSIGSSPTALTANSLAGITEIRAGVYMFGDLFQAGIGTCSYDDIAATVLTEVISRPAGSNSFLIDAGAFALSKDVSTASLPPEKNAGYGGLCDLDGGHLPGLKVERVWQEHGRVVSERRLAADEFPVGTRLRVLPNHACPTAAAHSAYHVVENSRAVVDTWPRLNGW
jgi:D-serine deaminase-like pyridoxal phosphate-dependent protein